TENNYEYGKEIVCEGLIAKKFEVEDAAVVCNLEKIGMPKNIIGNDTKQILFQSPSAPLYDKTSDYLTKLIGTAMSRSNKYHFDQIIYLNDSIENSKHFEILFKLLEYLKLNKTNITNYHYLSNATVLHESLNHKIMNADN